MNADQIYITIKISADASGIVVFGKFGKKIKIFTVLTKANNTESAFYSFVTT